MCHASLSYLRTALYIESRYMLCIWWIVKKQYLNVAKRENNLEELHNNF